jgi:hypothetical protein
VNVVRRSSFWPFLFGFLLLLGGTMILVSRLLAIAIDVSWWRVFAIVVGVGLVAFAVRKESGDETPLTRLPT